jgi:hypothetical protein
MSWTLMAQVGLRGVARASQGTSWIDLVYDMLITAVDESKGLR